MIWIKDLQTSLCFIKKKMFLKAIANHSQRQKDLSFEYQEWLATLCSECNTWGIASEGDFGCGFFRLPLIAFASSCIHECAFIKE